MNDSPRATPDIQTSHPRTATRVASRTPTPTHGSRTITVNATEAEQNEQNDEENVHVGILRLRGDMNVRRPRAIQWDESVIDNEHMNKKKSKICCIYHRPHAVGESSESESSSSSSESDSDSDSSSEGHERCQHHHHRTKRNKRKRNPREVSPNAYERQPVYKDRPQPPRSSS